MVLLKMILVSICEAAGDPESPEYGSLSPPTTSLTQEGSVFNGRWSQTAATYVIFFPLGT